MSERPFELGWCAGLAGDDPRTCPFEKLTAEWYEWQRWQAYATMSLRLGMEQLMSDKDLPKNGTADHSMASLGFLKGVSHSCL